MAACRHRLPFWNLYPWHPCLLSQQASLPSFPQLLVSVWACF